MNLIRRASVLCLAGTVLVCCVAAQGGADKATEPEIRYLAYARYEGVCQGWRADGQMAGSERVQLPIENLCIDGSKVGGMKYCGHQSFLGWSVVKGECKDKVPPKELVKWTEAGSGDSNRTGPGFGVDKAIEMLIFDNAPSNLYVRMHTSYAGWSPTKEVKSFDGTQATVYRHEDSEGNHHGIEGIQFVFAESVYEADVKLLQKEKEWLDVCSNDCLFKRGVHEIKQDEKDEPLPKILRWISKSKEWAKEVADLLDKANDALEKAKRLKEQNKK